MHKKYNVLKEFHMIIKQYYDQFLVKIRSIIKAVYGIIADNRFLARIDLFHYEHPLFDFCSRSLNYL